MADLVTLSEAKAYLHVDHNDDDKEWNITGIKEAKFGRHQFLEITAMTEI